MSGFYFDLYALGFAAWIASLTYVIWFLVTMRRGPRLHDWEKEWPEYGHPKEGHVTLVD